MLKLYPPGFRAEFESEMQGVFGATVEEAAGRGGVAVALACWRELREAPVAIIREHWRGRSHPMESQSLERASRWGLLAALVVFPLAAIPRREELPWIAQFVAFYGTFGLAAVSLMIGVVKGLPVWSLPSLGLFLAGFIYTTAFLNLNRFFMSLFPPYLPGPLYSIVNSGSLWLGLLAALIALAAAAATLPPLRPLHQRFQRDWTLLSFIVYGASPIGIYQTFDEYKHEGLYAVIGILLLAVGAWLYLRSALGRQRWLALFTALTLAMVAAAIGKWLILPVQDWPGLQGKPIPGFRYWSEVMPTLVEWGWIMIVMAVPALLMLLPRPRQTSERP
jgi:hypothetical protein